MQFFARQGVSVVLKSDSGPSFNGIELKNFAEHLGFRHEAEYFMKTQGKCVRVVTVEHKKRKQELCKFLRQYRATPRSTTNISPCEALNQR